MDEVARAWKSITAAGLDARALSGEEGESIGHLSLESLGFAILLGTEQLQRPMDHFFPGCSLSLPLSRRVEHQTTTSYDGDELFRTARADAIPQTSCD
jgi:hypothetical protein